MKPDENTLTDEDFINIDSYQPDYKSKCCNCGQTPCVTGVKDGKTIYESEMCGPCTFGEAECVDPANW